MQTSYLINSGLIVFHRTIKTKERVIILRLHSLCILQGGAEDFRGDLKFLEQKKGGYENCLNISGGMLIFCKILSSFCNGFKR